MPDNTTTPSDLIEEVFDERAQSLNLRQNDIEAGVVQLRQLFAEIRERAAANQQIQQVQPAAQPETSQRRLRYEAALRPGSYRLRFGNLTFRVILGETLRTSRILVDAGRDLLGSGSDAWGVVPAAALATRGGAEDQSRTEIAQEAGSAAGTVIADDTGDEPRVLVVIRGFPGDKPVPVMELAEETETEGADVIQVEPEVSPERLPTRRQRE